MRTTANVREIRYRIKSVKSTQQITKAMKMVSVAKLRRTQNGMDAMRVFSQRCQEILAHLLADGYTGQHPFLTPREEVRAVCYVLFLGNRGLCGMYNSALVRYAQEVLSAQSHPFRLVVVGRWGRDVLRQAGLQEDRRFDDFGDAPTMDEALILTDYLKGLYLREEADEIHLLYQHVQSILSQTPEDRQLLPAAPEHSGGGEEDYIFAPSAEQILDHVVQLYLNNTVLSVMQEARVGEHAARMTAMSAATDATTELIDDLSLALNRARQAAITTEISEIVGGANALHKAEQAENNR